MANYSLDNLADDIVAFYKEGMDELTESFMAAADECSQECLEDIKNDSPYSTEKYKEGWVRRKNKKGYVIYNKSKPYLEMPLEHGHIIGRGENRGKRVAGRPHIYDNEKRAIEKFENMCVDIVAEGVRFKYKRRRKR